MDRIITTVLATMAGTLFAVIGIPAQPDKAMSPPVMVETTLATTTTSPTTTIALPANVPSDKSKRCPEFEALFAKYQLPVEIFSYIAWRESNCTPNAVNARWDAQGNMIWHLNRNKSWDSGLLQVNSSWIRSVREVCGVNTGNKRKDLEVLYDPECNVKFAKWLMDNTKGGLANWSL